MKFAGALVPLLVSLSDIAAAVNNFKGLTVSNSIGGAATYTCRTQAQISFSYMLSQRHRSEPAWYYYVKSGPTWPMQQEGQVLDRSGLRVSTVAPSLWLLLPLLLQGCKSWLAYILM